MLFWLNGRIDPVKLLVNIQQIQITRVQKLRDSLAEQRHNFGDAGQFSSASQLVGIHGSMDEKPASANLVLVLIWERCVSFVVAWTNGRTHICCSGSELLTNFVVSVAKHMWPEPRRTKRSHVWPIEMQIPHGSLAAAPPKWDWDWTPRFAACARFSTLNNFSFFRIT